MINHLLVWHHHNQLGQIIYDDGLDRFSFSYCDEWLKSPNFWLSNRLTPDCLSQYSEDDCSTEIKRFLENLLPEGRALDDLSLFKQVSKINVFGLTEKIKRDMAGALLFSDESIMSRQVTVDELSHRVQSRDIAPFSLWDGKFVTSLAGYQDKIPVYRSKEGALWLSKITTHILKPEPRERRLKHLVINEYFCMRLAKEAGLSVAKVELLRVPEPVLLVTRFDRQVIDDVVMPNHIIDACQALGLPVNYKYERNFGCGKDVRHIREGVSFPKLFQLLDEREKRLLLRWLLFNYLVGNTDAHGKNVSFFVDQNGIRLAPMYDVVSCEIYDCLTHEASMAIGDEFVFESVKTYDWAELSFACDIPGGMLQSEMLWMAGAVNLALSHVSIKELRADELDCVKRIKQIVQSRAGKLTSDAKQVLKVINDL